MTQTFDWDRRGFLAVAASTVAEMELAMLGFTMIQPGGMKAARDTRLEALRHAGAWLNSLPLTEADLRGKVVLVEFWTYTCINWLRQFPYVRAWVEKYSQHGLVVIGVHTPEFAFEKDLDNVRQAATQLRVEYPIGTDNHYAIWRAFGNRYWPARYLFDAQGRIRHRHFGEGAYDQSERMIQRLLRRAGARSLGAETVRVDAHGIEAAADWDNLASPETYLGSARAERFVSTRGRATATGHLYAVPSRLQLNEWALEGDWTVGRQAVVTNAPGGRIIHRFHARDLHLVLAPKAEGIPGRYRVRIDGRPPGSANGVDVGADGNGVVTEPRLYQLIRQPRQIVDRQFDIEFLDQGVQALAFTFG